MRVTILGTGTSSGVPTLGCSCSVCLSTNPKDKRLRTSCLVQTGTTSLLVDTSADFRQQMLASHVSSLDAVIYTHHHFDHIAGFDDIRGFNFTSGRDMPIYLLEETYRSIRRIFEYAFTVPEQVGGGVPQVKVNIVDTDDITVGDLVATPLPMLHGRLRVNGYRFGPFAYCTDTNHIPEATVELLRGVDVLVIDALRYTSHPTHFTVDEAVAMAREIGAKQTFFTHMSHHISHDALAASLPPHIQPAYDGLRIEWDRNGRFSWT